MNRLLSDRPRSGRRPEEGPVCPECGRRAYCAPGPDGRPRYLTMLLVGDNQWRLIPHICLPRCVRYPHRRSNQ